MKVYAIYRCVALLSYDLLLIYSNRPAAEKQRDYLLSKLPSQEKPGFDEYGLVSGVNYIVVDHEVLDA